MPNGLDRKSANHREAQWIVPRVRWLVPYIIPPMVTFELFVQEGCVPDESRTRIVEDIEAVCVEVLGLESGPVSVSWTVIPKGFGFRGGEPSTTSLVRGRIPDGYGPDVRARFLRAIGESWCNLTGATQDELMVSARDWSWTG